MKQTNLIKKLQGVAIATLAFAIIGCGDDASTGNPEPTANIVETAEEAGVFNTLLAAVNAAGLTEVLADDGPFTVFAPTDEAFDKLPAGTVAELLEPQNIGLLTDILTYHVLAGRILAAEAVAAGSAETLNGQYVTITERDGEVRVNDAVVIQPNVLATNGVIHVINEVLLPD